MRITEQPPDQISLEFEYLAEGFCYIFTGAVWLLVWCNFRQEILMLGLIVDELAWGMGLFLILAGVYIFTLRKTIVFNKEKQKLYFFNKAIMSLRVKEYSLETIKKLKVYRYSEKGRYYYHLYLEILHGSNVKTIYLDTFSNFDELIRQGELLADFLGVEFLWCNPPRGT